MATDYQRKKTKYSLPTAVYHQTLWQIRDYYRLRELRDEILGSSAGPPDGMPGGTMNTILLARRSGCRVITIEI